MNQTPNPLAAPVVAPCVTTGSRVLVLGLGASGLAAASHAHRAGARVRVVDTRTGPPQLATLRERHADVPFVQCALADVVLDDTDLVIWSPGLSIELGEGAALAARIRAAGIVLCGELDLFVQALQRTSSPARIVAITGTNGKTTVCALATRMARAAGSRARAAGNIGPPMLDALHDAQCADALPDTWFLELSSFQLALCEAFDPAVATVLNVTPDHLDWHASFESYAAAKQRIFGAHTIAVLPDGHAAPERAAAVRRFSAGEPMALGDTGLSHHGGVVWLAHAQAGEADNTRKRGAAPAEILVKRLMPVDVLPIRGAHNHRNALAALALCAALDLPMAPMLHALRSYRGEPHRCQLLASIDGVDYYDDSKGTNVGSTCAALEGLGKRAWLIAGGVGKDQDFSPLVAPVAAHAAGVILLGADAGRIAQSLSASQVPLERVDSLGDAVQLAARRANPGEAVLLSPACASFDMFRDYRHRGAAFAEQVRALGEARGQVIELPC